MTMKCYQPEVYFASEIEDNNKQKFMEVVTLNLAGCATFPVTTAGVTCNALTDTSAIRSCINEAYYNQLMLLWLLKAFCFPVTSASGSTLCPMGIVQCPFKLGGHYFEFNFIVCQNLTRPIIFGLDFMHKHHIGLSWSDTGKGLIALEDKALVETVNICETGPQLMPYSSLILSPRMWVIVSVQVDLKENSTEHTYEVKPKVSLWINILAW